MAAFGDVLSTLTALEEHPFTKRTKRLGATCKSKESVVRKAAIHHLFDIVAQLLLVDACLSWTLASVLCKRLKTFAQKDPNITSPHRFSLQEHSYFMGCMA